MILNHIQFYTWDSYGAPAPEEILQFMRRARRKDGRKKKMIYSTFQIQDIDSTKCGYFCVYIAKMLLHGISLINILLNFDVGFKQYLNDAILDRAKKQVYSENLVLMNGKKNF